MYDLSVKVYGFSVSEVQMIHFDVSNIDKILNCAIISDRVISL